MRETHPVVAGVSAAAALDTSAPTTQATTWFFNNPEAVVRLLAARDAWRGTPWARNSRAQGPHGGIDCLGYIEELFYASGLPRFHFPRVPTDYSSHVISDRILAHLRAQHEDPQSAQLAKIFAEFPVKERQFELAAMKALGAETYDPFIEAPMVGDMLVLKDSGSEGKRENGVFHLPVMTGPRKFTHCARGVGGTQEGMIQDTFAKRTLVGHFRARA